MTHIINDQSRTKAQKLINLAQSGTPGERQTAMLKLDRLLRANNMTVDDLIANAPIELLPYRNAFYYMYIDVKRFLQRIATELVP